MDQFSLAELTELYFIRESGVDIQFQFWLTITFATVVATFVAGNRLDRKLRWVAAVLYLLATAVLVSRWYYLAIEAVAFRTAALESGVPLSVPWVTIVFRGLLVGVGTVAALWFLVRKESHKKGPTDLR